MNIVIRAVFLIAFIVMTTSSNGIEFLKRHEGLRLAAYQCSAGVWTIGYGHTGADTAKGRTITLDEAEALLRRDLKVREEMVNSRLKRAVSQSQFDALVSHVYNCGVSKTLFEKVNGGAADLRQWWESHYITGSGRELDGLVKRRQAEVELYYSNSDGTKD